MLRRSILKGLRKSELKCAELHLEMDPVTFRCISHMIFESEAGQNVEVDVIYCTDTERRDSEKKGFREDRTRDLLRILIPARERSNQDCKGDVITTRLGNRIDAGKLIPSWSNGRRITIYIAEDLRLNFHGLTSEQASDCRP